MKAILFDMDGVLYVGDRLIEGAIETLDWARREGIPFRFVTNTTSKPRDALVEKLAGMGIEATADEILTPPVAARQWLSAHEGEPAALFVPDATAAEFAELAAADSVDDSIGALVMGDLGEGWDFATYNRAFRWLKANPEAALVALGMTRFWQAEDGPRLDVGPFVRGLEYALDRDAVVLGKPSRDFFHSALETLGVDAAETVMIGDDIVGDIGGAQQAGLVGLQVRSGKFHPNDLKRGITPDGVLDGIAQLPTWWQRHADDQSS
ncbi:MULTISPECIES: TIGR01458 family HAD-type hydrolase [unclassified Guyparkeria]|uniref:TIGR01458 family HAD-type hydrolase n=1 Tax=unclassified Guyparkeria TaxID=2626246 RepID=UPI0007335B9B|nr:MULTISPECIES: TIGR01458 family HAD-type hydrolase [unclassified Guyparkeria]KTG17410.1 haloacid dehalogenase [Guyparkeria sp. XI15]OAE87387.1 haloacid dehalogenase [Guyparkeria sp. WRN-7]